MTYRQKIYGVSFFKDWELYLLRWDVLKRRTHKFILFVYRDAHIERLDYVLRPGNHAILCVGEAWRLTPPAVVMETHARQSSNSSWHDDEVASLRSVVVSFLGLVLLTSLALNGTICLLFYRKRQLVTVANSFVLNLTACQLGESRRHLRQTRQPQRTHTNHC